MRVVLDHMSKKFGDVAAVNDLDLEMRSGEFVALLGPSGCGKTTTLLMVAGIYRPTSGTIVFGDRRVDHLHPKDRGIGMVFQSYALYPHMTVSENIAFPLELQRGVARPDREARVREAAAKVQVDERGSLTEIYSEAWPFTDEPLVYVYQTTIRVGWMRTTGWAAGSSSAMRPYCG